MKPSPAALCLLLLAGLANPAAAQPEPDELRPDERAVEPPEYGSVRVLVQPEHLPPPGLCRAWFPDLPPERQSPPEPCGPLRADLPEGAILLDGGPGHDGAYAETVPPEPDAPLPRAGKPSYTSPLEPEESPPEVESTEAAPPEPYEAAPVAPYEAVPLEPAPPAALPPRAEAAPPAPRAATGLAWDPDRPRCREVQIDMTIGGRPQAGFGAACLQPDGSWQLGR